MGVRNKNRSELLHLLEQHDNYEIGGGFSVDRRPGRPWHVYYDGMAIDLDEEGDPKPRRDVIDAIQRAKALREKRESGE